MSLVMNPAHIKRREHLGLTALAVGIIALFTGVICLLYKAPLGLTLISFGSAATATGILILKRIPDVVTYSQEPSCKPIARDTR
jgi:hypothetical protein